MLLNQPTTKLAKLFLLLILSTTTAFSSMAGVIISSAKSIENSRIFSSKNCYQWDDKTLMRYSDNSINIDAPSDFYPLYSNSGEYDKNFILDYREYSDEKVYKKQDEEYIFYYSIAPQNGAEQYYTQELKKGVPNAKRYTAFLSFGHYTLKVYRNKKAFSKKIADYVMPFTITPNHLYRYALRAPEDFQKGYEMKLILEKEFSLTELLSDFNKSYYKRLANSRAAEQVMFQSYLGKKTYSNKKAEFSYWSGTYFDDDKADTIFLYKLKQTLGNLLNYSDAYKTFVKYYGRTFFYSNATLYEDKKKEIDAEINWRLRWIEAFDNEQCWEVRRDKLDAEPEKFSFYDSIFQFIHMPRIERYSRVVSIRSQASSNKKFDTTELIVVYNDCKKVCSYLREIQQRYYTSVTFVDLSIAIYLADNNMRQMESEVEFMHDYFENMRLKAEQKAIEDAKWYEEQREKQYERERERARERAEKERAEKEIERQRRDPRNWKLGDRLYHTNDNRYFFNMLGSIKHIELEIEQFNEDRSKFKGNIVHTDYTEFNGKPVYPNSTIWLDCNPDYWYRK